MAGVCPYHVLSGHTAIASHYDCFRGSVASYGGRCPVGQQPVSTRVEGRYLPDGWHYPTDVVPNVPSRTEHNVVELRPQRVRTFPKKYDDFIT